MRRVKIEEDIVKKTKAVKRQKRTKINSADVKNVLSEILELWTGLYMIVLTAVVTFYIKGGYDYVASAKYGVLYYSSIVFFAAAIPLAFIIRLFSDEKWRLSVTDILMIAMTVSFTLTFVFSPWQGSAWTGWSGWYMGFRTFLICFGIYFFVSRALRNRNFLTFLIAIAVASSTLAFLWGLVDSLPLHFGGEAYSQNPVRLIMLPGYDRGDGTFAIDRIGPLGNVDWFCGYYSVFFPLTLGLTFAVKKKFYRIPLIICTIIGTLFGIFEEADSGRIVLIVCAFGAWWYLFWHMGELTKTKKRIRMIPLLLLFIGALTVVIMIIVNTLKPGSIGPLSDKGFFTFDDYWGNGRGINFKSSIELFRQLFFIWRAFGIGEDCFAQGIYGIEEVANALNQFHGGAVLSNAHNEFITMIINMGVVGTALFYGTSLYSSIRALKESNEEDKRILGAFALPVLCYLIHNMVSFQTSINTPYFFMMLGLIENYRTYYLLGKKESEFMLLKKFPFKKKALG